MMAAINSTPRPAYVYDEATSQWYELAGRVNTAAAYTWTQSQTFDASVTMNSVVVTKNLNIFLNPSARDTAISSPVYGTMVFLKQNANGDTINDLQIYTGSTWESVVDPVYVFNQKSTSYTLVIADAFKMIEMSAGGTLTIPLDSTVNFPVGTAIDILQTGSSQVTIAGASGVTVNATPGLKLRTQWSSATIIKRAANTWVAMGDLVA
jgi:hypothetical protein